jgi:hypothetical protein
MFRRLFGAASYGLPAPAAFAKFPLPNCLMTVRSFAASPLFLARAAPKATSGKGKPTPKKPAKSTKALKFKPRGRGSKSRNGKVDSSHDVDTM